MWQRHNYANNHKLSVPQLHKHDSIAIGQFVAGHNFSVSWLFVTSFVGNMPIFACAWWVSILFPRIWLYRTCPSLNFVFIVFYTVWNMLSTVAMSILHIVWQPAEHWHTNCWISSYYSLIQNLVLGITSGNKLVWWFLIRNGLWHNIGKHEAVCDVYCVLKAYAGNPHNYEIINSMTESLPTNGN